MRDSDFFKRAEINVADREKGGSYSGSVDEIGQEQKVSNGKDHGDISKTFEQFYLVNSDLSAVESVFKLLDNLIWVSATARSDRWDFSLSA